MFRVGRDRIQDSAAVVVPSTGTVRRTVRTTRGFARRGAVVVAAVLLGIGGMVAVFVGHSKSQRAAAAEAARYANLADECYLSRSGLLGQSEPATDEPLDETDAVVVKAGLDYAQQLYAQNCSSCHGTRAQGMPRQGANLRTSTFIAGLADDDLVTFLKQGRQPTDPRSVLNLPMPPRGGNPSLSDERLKDIVNYLRLLQRLDGAGQSAQAPAAEVRTAG